MGHGRQTPLARKGRKSEPANRITKNSSVIASLWIAPHERGKRVAFWVPALSLIDQTVAAFEAEGLYEIGVVQGCHPRSDPDAPIQIASVQTLARRAWPGVDLVLVDEAHLAFKSLFQWMRARAHLPFVGLSATPWTRGLGRHYDDLIVAARMGDLIDAGYLSKFIVYAPSASHLSGVSMSKTFALPLIVPPSLPSLRVQRVLSRLKRRRRPNRGSSATAGRSPTTLHNSRA